MSIKDIKFYKYIGVSIFCGLLSATMADICCYLLLSEHIIGKTMHVPLIMIASCGMGGIIAWIFCKRYHYLALATYCISFFILVILGIIDGWFYDPSVNGWLLLALIGYAYICAPICYLNKRLFIPKLLQPK